MKNKKHLILIIIAIIIITFIGVMGAFNAVAQAQNNEYINLNVPIPLPNCPGQLGDSVRCQEGTNLVDGVKDAPTLVVALFQFGIILGAVIMVAIMVIGGVMILASAGFQSRIQQARDMIKRAAFALLVLLFSVAIITQVNPNLLSLTIQNTNNTAFTNIAVCGDFAPEDSNDNDNIDQNEIDNAGLQCNAQEGCVWGGSVCLSRQNLACEAIADESVCRSLSEGQNASCAFLETTSKCVTVRNQTAGECELLAFDSLGSGSQSEAQKQSSCLSGIGCIWDRGCQLKDNQQSIDFLNSSGFNPCVANTTVNACISNGLCEWATDGACFKQSDSLNRNCASFTEEDTCPFTCFWDSDADPEICKDSPAPGSKDCSSHSDCPLTMYCSASSEKCETRIGINEECDGEANGLFGDDDRVCQPGLECYDLATDSCGPQK